MTQRQRQPLRNKAAAPSGTPLNSSSRTGSLAPDIPATLPPDWVILAGVGTALIRGLNDCPPDASCNGSKPLSQNDVVCGPSRFTLHFYKSCQSITGGTAAEYSHLIRFYMSTGLGNRFPDFRQQAALVNTWCSALVYLSNTANTPVSDSMSDKHEFNLAFSRVWKNHFYAILLAIATFERFLHEPIILRVYLSERLHPLKQQIAAFYTRHSLEIPSTHLDKPESTHRVRQSKRRSKRRNSGIKHSAETRSIIITMLPSEIIREIGNYLAIHNYMALHSTCKYLLDDGFGYFDKQLVFDRAVDLDQPKLIRKLIDHPKIDPLARYHAVLKPAFRSGYVDVVSIILANPRIDMAEVNDKMRYATINDHPDLIRYLLSDSRIDTSAEDSGILVWACKYGHLDIVDILLKDQRVDCTAKSKTLFASAIRHGHLKVVERLLSDKRIDSAANYNSALKKSCKHGRIEILKILLYDEKCDPNGRYGKPLNEAIYFQRWDIIKLMVSDPRTHLDMSIFWDICIAGGISIVQYVLYKVFVHRAHTHNRDAYDIVTQLLSDPRLSSGSQLLSESGVDPSVDDNFAIEKACNSRVEQPEIVLELLRDSRVNPAANSNAAFRYACRNNYLLTVQILLRHGRVDPSAEKNSAFIHACKNNNVELVKLLLADPRVNPADDDNLAFIYACKNNNVELVKLLLADPRINPADDDNVAFVHVCQYNQLELVKLLLSDNRVDPSVNNAAFGYACDKGHEAIVKILLSDPRIDPTYEDHAALRYSCFIDHKGVFELLIRDPRSDPSIGNNMPFAYACESGLTDIVNMLLSDPRVDPSANDGDALRRAIIYSRIDVIRSLLSDPRVDPSICSNAVLHFACQRGLLDIVQHLLSDPRVDPSDNGNSALLIASHFEHFDIVDLLKSDERVLSLLYWQQDWQEEDDE